jgi:tetratricopeptide (TPR) repeat protein
VLITGRRGDVALPLLDAASVEFADLEGEAVGAALGGQLARAHYLTGNLRQAEEIADLVLRTAEGLDLVPIVADTLVTKGSALSQDGRSTEGLALLRAGQELAERKGLAETFVRATNNRAALESSRDPRAALETGRAGLAAAMRLGHRFASLTENTAWAARRVGDWTLALAVLDDALAEEIDPVNRAELLYAANVFHALLGDPTDEGVAEIERLIGGATDPQMMATLDNSRGWVAFGEGRFREARERWRRVIELISSPEDLSYPARAALWDHDVDAARSDLAAFDTSGVHGPALEADRSTIRAGIAALEGRTADALALYREALRAWRDLGIAWDEALCGVDMALLLDAAEPEVRAAAESARETLTRLGAKPILERLEAAMTRQTRQAAPPNQRASRPRGQAETVPGEV